MLHCYHEIPFYNDKWRSVPHCYQEIPFYDEKWQSVQKHYFTLKNGTICRLMWWYPKFPAKWMYTHESVRYSLKCCITISDGGVQCWTFATTISDGRVQCWTLLAILGVLLASIWHHRRWSCAAEWLPKATNSKTSKLGPCDLLKHVLL